MAKIKIDDGLFNRVKKVAEIGGYADPEEFIVHMIEKELAKIDDTGSEAEVTERLKGLGYLE